MSNIVQEIINKVADELVLRESEGGWTEMGGKGSGNWGHKGRPGKRGGSAPSKGRTGKPMTAPDIYGSDNPTKEVLNLLSNDLPVPEGFTRDEIDDYGWEEAEDETAAMVKVEIAKNLSEHAGVSEGDASKFVQQWARSSNSEDMRSLGIQESASELFDVPLSDWQRQRIENSREGAGISSEYLMGKNIQKNLLQSMYNQTQSELSSAGLSEGDTVRAFRGVKFGDTLPEWSDGDKIAFKGNALESWTLSSDVAREFSDGIILVADIPKTSVVSTARTGFGCLKEGEIVALGSVPGSKVLIWNEMEEIEEWYD